MDDTRQWLHSLGLGEYAEAFEENAIGWDHLADLDHDILKEIGVGVVGHRLTILKAVSDLRSEAEPPPAEASKPVSSPERRTPSGEAERRQVTVMFCDLVGSTALSQRLDAEDLRELLTACQSAWQATIEQFDGFVARYMGDGVLAYFGYPQAHENDAERAVHAGLAVVASMEGVNAGPARVQGVELHVRVGIATGPVVVGDLIGKGASQESAVVGETPNLAARLQGVAVPDSVVVSLSTQHLSEGSINYVNEGPRNLDGFSAPIGVWRAVGTRSRTSTLEVNSKVELAPLVGRNPELSLLLDRWQRAKVGEGQVVLICGEAGIGKTRLLQEFQLRIENELRNRVLYSCSPFQKHSPFYPAREQLSSGFRLGRDEDTAQKLDKIEQGLAILGLLDHEIVALLASLQAIPTEGRFPELRLDPEHLRQRLIEAIISVTEAMAARHPVLQIVEDLHWADPSTLELVQHMIERCRCKAILHAVTVRPDFSAPWAAGTNIAALTLSNLSNTDSKTIIEQVTGGRALPESLRRDILERTDGIPLFIEELTKSVIESSVVEDTERGFTLADDSSMPSIPESLHDSLMARLDRLPDGKDLIQLASVIGKQFSHELISATSQLEERVLTNKLEGIIKAGLIHRLGVAPNAAYEFKHALIQEAAYESLLHAKRRELHARIAEVLQERAPDVARAHPEVLARHCARGGLSEQAVEFWSRAGEMAMGRAAHREAVACFEGALGALNEVGNTPEKLQRGVELRLRLRAGLFAIGELARMYPFLDEAEGIAARLGDDRQVADINVNKAWALGFQGRSVAAIESAERALKLASKLGDESLCALADTALGWLYVFVGPSRQAIEHLNKALSVLSRGLIHERLGQTGVRSVFALSNIALANASLGKFDEAVIAGGKALEIATEVAHPYDISYAEWCLGSALVSGGRITEAIPHLEDAARVSRANQIRVVTAWSVGELGRANLLLDQLSKAVSHIEQAMALARETGIRRQTVSLTAYLTDAYYRSGALDTARPLAAKTLDECRKYDFHVLEPAALRLKVLLDIKRDSEGHQATLSKIDESIEFAKQLGLSPEVAHGHLALARVYQRLGRIDDANREQALAIHLYQDMNMGYWIQKAENLDMSSVA